MFRNKKKKYSNLSQDEKQTNKQTNWHDLDMISR